MTEELEYALRKTFADAADRAPKAPPGLMAGLETRRTRARLPRGGFLQLALVAATVVALAGGTAVLTRGVGSSDGGHALQRSGPVKAPPIEKVWPDAVHKVPGTLPNGRAFTPQGFIDDHTMVVTTESSFEKTDALYRYDLRTNTAKKITTVLGPPSVKAYASGFTVGGGYVAWAFELSHRVDIWVAPVSGGQGHRIISQPGGKRLSRLVIDHGNVLWSLDGTGGVYRAPLTGGTPKLIGGSEGMHILAWPWIGTPYGVEGVGEKQNEFEHVVNTETGETRQARLSPNAGMWACGVTWCTGNGRGGATEVERRDGTGHRAIPGQGAAIGDPPALDRFVITLPTRDTVALYDVRTGRMGDLGAVGGRNGVSFQRLKDPANRLYAAKVADGYLVVDLGAIA